MEHKKVAVVAGGLTVATSTLFIPKVRQKIQKTLLRLIKVLKRADSPDELKNEAKDEMTDILQTKFKEGLQSKVNHMASNFQQTKEENAAKIQENAYVAKKKTQEALLKTRKKIADAKNTGGSFTEKNQRRS